MVLDDMLYVKPDGVQMEGTALSLKLTRTKTTGAGKRVQLMYAYFAGGAWVVEPNWLVAGLEIFRRIAGNVKRDYLLPLPDSFYTGVRASPVLYADSLVFGRLLLRELRDAEGVQLLDPITAL